MSVKRLYCQKHFYLIIGAFLMTTAFQVYLDIRRTSILDQSQLRHDVAMRQYQDGGEKQNGDQNKNGYYTYKPGVIAPVTKDPDRRLANISMKQYFSSFPNSQKAQVCEQLDKPKARDFTLYKDTYHHFKITPKGYDTTDAYVLNFYYDDRFLHTGSKYIRTYVCIRGIGPERQAAAEDIKKTAVWTGVINNTPTHVMLWYDEFTNPIAVQCSTKPAFGITRTVSNVFYYEFIITCPLPEIDLLPTHASLMQDGCVSPTNIAPIIFPRPARFVGARDIGVCMASLYGSLNASAIPYFVSWMEALSMYGVIEVNMNNALMRIDSEMMRVMDYYIERGRLVYTRFPVMHETWRDFEEDAATESTNRMHVGHCFLSNVKRYWHTLVIDLDELPVPLKAGTYAQTLDALGTAKTGTDGAQMTDAHCHTMRSAFFYFDFPPGNPEYPTSLPLHRYTNRFRPEPVELGHNDGLGLGKSFHNSRRVVAMGHHLCRSSHDEVGVHLLKHSKLDEADILIHHYRKQCKYSVDCTNRTKLMIDDHIPKTIGVELKKRVEKVFNDLDIHFDN